MLNNIVKIILIVFASVGASSLTAAPIEIDTSDWLYDFSPSSGVRSDQDIFVGLELNAPEKTGNSSGTLLSNFILEGDFSFSGSFTPTIADNISCVSNEVCNDNDIIGLVFGWQDPLNHYRLGWNQGGIADITGREGLYLIREVNGESNTLRGQINGGIENNTRFNFADVFWRDELTYGFDILKEASKISVTITGVVQNTADEQSGSAEQSLATRSFEEPPSFTFQLDSTDFVDGQIGVYTESQTARFENIEVTGTAFYISAPATLSTMCLGLMAVWLRRKPNQ